MYSSSLHLVRAIIKKHTFHGVVLEKKKTLFSSFLRPVEKQKQVPLNFVSYVWKEGSWLIKMDSNDCVISIFRPRHRKRLPIARKLSAIWGTWMVSKNN